MIASGDPLAAPLSLIDASIQLSSAFIADVDPTCLHPDEAAALTERAVASRRQEFAAGRTCAARAMAKIGMPILPIGIAIDRSPVWPVGIVGSISHSSTIAAAALARRESGIRAVGLDIEEALPLDLDLLPEICVHDELTQLGSQTTSRQGLLGKALFCAKEATYKAQYPVSGQLFGFHTLSVELDLDARCFSARFLQDASPFSAGDLLHGQIWIASGHLVAVLALR